MTKISKITLGTKQWADHNINCYSGCYNNCRYCYAKMMAIRFKRKTEINWKEMEMNKNYNLKTYRKRAGRFMFPTSHDIIDNEKVLSTCIDLLEKLLKVGNTVLITTKPNLNVISKLCRLLEKYKKNIQFRFTITTNESKLLEFWEPNAPNFKERLESLKFAYNNNYKTSISVEPFLSNPLNFINYLKPFVSESIWIGPMNYIKINNIKPNEIEFYNKIRSLYSPISLYSLYNQLRKIVKIQIKDSFFIKLYNAGLILDFENLSKFIWKV